MEIINWIASNWEGILTAVTAVIAAASAICALTPTPVDDNWVKKIYGLIEALALNIGKAKE